MNRQERRASGTAPKTPKPDLLSHPDAQRVLWLIEGLLNGTKKLVIVSEATLDTDIIERGGEREVLPIVHYKHTFKVEDTSPNGT